MSLARQGGASEMDFATTTRGSAVTTTEFVERRNYCRYPCYLNAWPPGRTPAA